jgi:hypothetical protein
LHQVHKPIRLFIFHVYCSRFQGGMERQLPNGPTFSVGSFSFSLSLPFHYFFFFFSPFFLPDLKFPGNYYTNLFSWKLNQIMEYLNFP